MLNSKNCRSPNPSQNEYDYFVLSGLHQHALILQRRANHGPFTHSRRFSPSSSLYPPSIVWNSIMLIAAKVKTHRHGTFTFFSPLLLVRDSYYTEKLFVETQFWMELNCTIWNVLDTLTMMGSVKSVLNTADLYTYFLAKSPWRHWMIPEQVMNVRTKWCNPRMKCNIKHLWSYLHFKHHD